MGQIHLDRGEFGKAEELFVRSLAISELSQDSLHLAASYASLGNLYEAQGRYQQALDYHLRALAIKRIIDTPTNIANTLLHIGQVYQQAGNFTRALQNFREALKLLTEVGAQRELAQTQKQIGIAYLKANNYSESAKFLQQSLLTAQAIDALDVIQDAYRQLSNLYTQTNEPNLALSYANRYQTTRDQIHEQQSNRRLAELEISYELDKRNKELDLLKQRSMIQELDYRKKANLLVSILTFSIVISLLFVGFLIYRQRLIRNAEKEKLENILRMKADFTAMLVHDLRSPLTSVFGYAELLKMGNKDASKVREIATTITQASQKMLLLVNEMLDFSKFEAGKMAISREPVNLRTVVGTSIQMLKPIAAQKSSNIEFVYEEDTPKVDCDPRKIEQVITNLLGNAVKHTPEETTVLCRLKSVEENGRKMIEFSVEDDGPGIDPEYQKTIFDKYAQLEKENSTIDLGTGLGLAVSKMIIDAHNGRIGYRPGDPRGSIFYFRLRLDSEVQGSENSIS
jgi:signal transduction histidine kinase